MRPSSLKKQHGIATVLIILLVGVALTASTLGIIYSVKTTQNKQITSHAKTNVQSAAWSLAEAARIYLIALNSEELIALQAELDSGTKTITPELSAEMAHLQKSTVTFNSVMVIGGKPRFDITVNAVDTLSQAATQLNVVFEITPATTGQQCLAKSESRFTGDIIGDHIDLYGSGPKNEIVVDGSYGSVDSLHSLHNISTFKATGDVFLDGTANDTILTTVQADGDITLKIATDGIQNVLSGKDVTVLGNDKSITKVIAAGNIDWQVHNGGTTQMHAGVKTTNAQGDDYNAEGFRTDKDGEIRFTKSGTQSELWSRASLNLTAGNTPNELKIGKAYSLDSLNFIAFTKTTDLAIAVNDINCNSIVTITEAKAGNALNGCKGFSDDSGIGLESAIESEVKAAMVEYSPVNLPPSLIADADAYNANYSFTYEEGKVIVAVKNIYGVADGDYSLSTSNTLVTTRGQPTDTGFNICGNQTQACITFTPAVRILTDVAAGLIPKRGNGTLINEAPLRTTPDDRGVIEITVPEGLWEVTNKAEVLAPGVYYFDRDLRIQGANNKNYVTSILSAGHIQLTNPIRLFAINGVGDEVLCRNQNFDVSSTQHSGKVSITLTPNSLFYPLQNGSYPYPTNYCDVDDQGQLTRIVSPDDYIGQFALLAGQENATSAGVPESYQGGNIFVQSSLEVYGRVIAGNAIKFVLGSNVEVFGTVGSEARAQGKDTAKNELIGTVDINTEYMDTLDKSGTNNGDICSEKDVSNASGSLLWSRYL